MQFLAKSLTVLALSSILTLTLALPQDTTPIDSPVPEAFDPNRSCSGQRLANEVCTGVKYPGPQNSFHNCARRGGKCCASLGNGGKGIDVSKGLGREDCGYCFSGRCGVLK